MTQLKPFTHTAKGLPFCLTPHPEYPAIYRVTLCGIQVAEAFHGTALHQPQAFFVSFGNSSNEDLPEILDVAVYGPDIEQRMRAALDRFAELFLAAAESEQLRVTLGAV